MSLAIASVSVLIALVMLLWRFPGAWAGLLVPGLICLVVAWRLGWEMMRRINLEIEGSRVLFTISPRPGDEWLMKTRLAPEDRVYCERYRTFTGGRAWRVGLKLQGCPPMHLFASGDSESARKIQRALSHELGITADAARA